MVFILIINAALLGRFLENKYYTAHKSACIYCLFVGGKGKDS